MRRGRTNRRRNKGKTKSDRQRNISHEQKYVKLQQWLQANGARGHPLRPTYFPDTGRGLMATESIKEGDMIVSIPANLLITTQTALKSDLKCALESYTIKLSARLLLCAFIIYERHKGDSSFWAPYIRCLPKAFSTPSYFASEECQRLPESLTQRVREQKQLVCDGFDKLSRFFACSQKSTLLVAFPFTLKDFMWAWFAVNTRTLYKMQDGYCREGLVDPAEKDVYVLAPFMDLLNHSSSAKVSGSFNSTSQCYEIQAMTPYRRFDQVFIHYGAHDNETLLLEYGFVVPSNPHSVVVISREDAYRCSAEVMSPWVSESIMGLLSERHKWIETSQGIWDVSCSSSGLSWHLTVILNILCMGAEGAQERDWKSLLGGKAASTECLTRSTRVAEKILCCYLERTAAICEKLMAVQNNSYHHQMTIKLMEEKKSILEECLTKVRQQKAQHPVLNRLPKSS